MWSRINGILAFGALALFGPVVWFYDNLTFDALIKWLGDHGIPEAQLIASLPPALITGAIIWAIYTLLRRGMEKKYAGPHTPDISLKKALDYIVNDSGVALKRPRPPFVADFGAAAGSTMHEVGVEYQDALRLLYETLIGKKIEAWGMREIKPRGPYQWESARRNITEDTPDYWKDMTLDPAAWRADVEGNQETTFLPHAQAPRYARYTGIMLNKWQIERVWPRRAFWKRLRRFLCKESLIYHNRPSHHVSR